MKKLTTLFLFVGLCLQLAYSQFITPQFNYRDTTMTYGTAVDFGGNIDSLQMDVSIPTNDHPPLSGRPLMLLIHGGSFLGGTKNDADIQNMRIDFARRGYVTAAINYRLGMFQTVSNWHCNITGVFGLEWDCLNQTDTLEWVRACYRAVQDANGAIRYLVNHAASYNIDPKNIFVVGQSAGAFVALGTGFMDVVSEVPYGVGTRPDAPLPNSIYDAGCVQRYGWDVNLASLSLTRPNLGSFVGTMNPTTQSYRIRGVGDFYGAVFEDLFAVNAVDTAVPCLYIYHQQNDLLVPYNHKHVLYDYSECAANNFGCSPILSRPFVSGGNHIKSMIDAHVQQGHAAPEYYAELLNTFGYCDPATHSIDNYTLRTHNMAVFFAPKIDTTIVGSAERARNLALEVYPNPSQGQFRIVLPSITSKASVSVTDLAGKVLFQTVAQSGETTVQLPKGFARGTYLLHVQTQEGRTARRILLE